MNDEKKTAGDAEAAEETDAPAQEAETAEETAAPEAEAAAEEAAEEGTAEEYTPESRVAALEAEVADLKDRLVRSFAEVENTRRRADKERQNASKYGASGLARDLLEAIDNLRRAIDSVPAG